MAAVLCRGALQWRRCPARRRAVWGDIQAARVLRPPPEKDDRQGVFYACCSSPRASQPAISVSLAFPANQPQLRHTAWAFDSLLLSTLCALPFKTLNLPPRRSSGATRGTAIPQRTYTISTQPLSIHEQR